MRFNTYLGSTVAFSLLAAQQNTVEALNMSALDQQNDYDCALPQIFSLQEAQMDFAQTKATETDAEKAAELEKQLAAKKLAALEKKVTDLTASLASATNTSKTSVGAHREHMKKTINELAAPTLDHGDISTLIMAILGGIFQGISMADTFGSGRAKISSLSNMIEKQNTHFDAASMFMQRNAVGSLAQTDTSTEWQPDVAPGHNWGFPLGVLAINMVASWIGYKFGNYNIERLNIRDHDVAKLAQEAEIDAEVAHHVEFELRVAASNDPNDDELKNAATLATNYFREAKSAADDAAKQQLVSSARTLAERANKAKSNAETLRQNYALRKEKKTLRFKDIAGVVAAARMAKNEVKEDVQTVLDDDGAPKLGYMPRLAKVPYSVYNRIRGMMRSKDPILAARTYHALAAGAGILDAEHESALAAGAGTLDAGHESALDAGAGTLDAGHESAHQLRRSASVAQTGSDFATYGSVAF